jgi:putative nucleotidyltransferase with HDIG domain
VGLRATSHAARPGVRRPGLALTLPASAARARAAALALALAGITAAHLLVSVRTHREHVLHVLFAGLYLLPVVASAAWFRLRGAILTAGAASAAYAAHVFISWRGQPMENVNQVAMIGVFLFVGVAAGVLAEREERERTRRLESERRAERAAIIQGIAGLSNALGFRDEGTRAHSERTARLAVGVGTRLGLDAERLEVLRLAALMHDVGKIGVRDDVLFKPDELTPQERATIERHPAVAAEILRPIHGAERIAEIVLSHHECPDGSGYPRGLAGDQIPLEARILRVADVFSALREDRPYKAGMSPSRAVAWMQGLAGTKLDRDAFEALRDALDWSGDPAPAPSGEAPG